MDFIPGSFELQTFLTLLLGLMAIFLSIYKIQNGIMKTISAVLVVLITASLYFVSLNVHNEQEKRITAQEKKLDDLTNEVRSDLANKNLDVKDIIAKLEAAHKDIFQMSVEDSKKWADEFEKTLPQKKVERGSISLSEHELAEKLEIRWNPLYNFILSTFDNTILELQKKNLVTYYEKSDNVELIQFQNYNPQISNVRLASLPNKRTLYIKVNSAIILRGKLERPLIITFTLTYSADYLLQIAFYENSVAFSTLDSPIINTAKDPLLDQEFRTQLINSIHNSIERAYLEETIN